MVKKILIGIGIFLIVVIIALATAPMIFKEEIKTAIDEQLEANVNADVLYDIDNFGVSFFTNFPNLTAGITELGVVGREPFAGEVLFAVDKFQIELNFWKLLSSEMSVQGIYLHGPEIFIKVLKDGTANYDIAISSDEPEEAPVEESGDFNFAIEHWSISDGHIIYNDATLPTYVEFTNFNHNGSGNFSLSVFDLITSTNTYVKELSYDGVSYMAKRAIDLDLILNMDLDQMKFTFGDNQLAINEFAFGFDGWIAMPGDDIDMDLSFESRKNSFKSLISLIPTMYSTEFDNLETSGELAFNGAIKGRYNEISMPAYDINLSVSDGMFHYPDLPETVNNVQLAMNVVSADGNVDNTAIDISKFHMEFGKEPINGFLKISNLVSYPVDMELNTSVNLANLNHLIPMEGLDLNGLLEASIKIQGEYDSLNATIPLIDAQVSFSDGSIRSSDLPAPLDAINMESSLINSTGAINDTKLAISKFAMELDGNPITGELLAENFDNLHWRALLNGDLNFDKLFPIIDKVYPLPGMTLSGDIVANITSEGKMSDLEAENYAALKTSGKAVFTNFVYTDSVYLPQGFAINSGELRFDPKAISVDAVSTSTGSSDFTFNGSLNNYLAYIFNNDVIKGRLKMRSRLIDVNEFMTESTDDGAEETETEEYSVVEVPENIDFVFAADIDKVVYDNLSMTDAIGDIIIKEGKLIFDGLSTKTLGGSITFDGSYTTKDQEKPVFDMKLDVKSVAIQDAYSAFNTIRLMAPIAKDVGGKASSLFSLQGVLKDDMMPDMATLNGAGKVSVYDATLKESKFASGLTSFLKGGESQSLTLKDVIMNVKISDGRLQVEPFDLMLNNSKANIAGMTGLDGSVDYVVKMDVPAGQLGSQFNALLGSVTGSENTSESIRLNIGVGGSYDDPKFNLLGADGQSTIKTVATEKAADLVKETTGVDVPVTKEELNEEAIAKAREEADKLLAEAQKQANIVKAEAKKSADLIREEAKVQADKLIKDAGSNVFKKTAAEIASKKLVDEAEKQAVNVEAEGNKQADSIMATAREKADTLIKNAENK